MREIIGLLREPDLTEEPAPLPYPTMLQELAREALQSRPLYDYRGRTREQVEARLREVRRVVRRCLHIPPGALPARPYRVAERNPVHFDAFSIAPIDIERTNGWHTTAHLYVPDGIRQPAPAVIHLHGHSYAGKSTVMYARRCRGLARHGFVVLFVDFPGAGEREGTGHALFYPTMANLPLQRVMVEDSSAALSYLASLPFVDAERIGVTGPSGGGNQTAFLSAVDPRVAASAPTDAPCLIAEHAASGSGTYCHCEAAPGMVGNGVEYHDLLAAVAPRPLHVFAGIRDPLFPIIGARKAVAEAAAAYAAVGATGLCTMEEHYCMHAVPAAMREGIYRFFEQTLKRRGDVAGPRDEGDDIDLSDPRLRALPKAPSRFLTVGDLYRRALSGAKPKRPNAARLNRLMGRRASDSNPTCMVTRTRKSETVALLKTGDGAVVPVVIKGDGGLVTLLVSDKGKQDALRDARGAVASFDWRGQGETSPPKDQWEQRAMHYLSYAGRSLPGGRVTDLICVVRWLRHGGREIGKVVAMGGEASLIALLAASVEAGFPRIELYGLMRTLKQAPSMGGQVHYTAWVPGLALETDVPQLLKALGARAAVNRWLKPGVERPQEGYD